MGPDMRWSLSLKLVIWLGAALSVVFLSVGYWSRQETGHRLEDQSTASAERMSDVIRRATRHSMLRNAREEVYFTIRSVGAQPGMRRIRIYNPEGRISFSTEESEIDHMVDKSAEACYACHAQSQPLVKLNRPDRVRFFQQASGGRLLGLITPIENEPDCSNSGCHAHPPSQRVLGVLDVQLSMAAADAQADAFLRRQLLLDALGLVLVLGLMGTLVWRLVHVPVKRLMAGTRRFAGGDLSYRIEVHSRDEIGALAASLNRMGGELHAARDENARWTETLEQRVEEKTAQVQQAVQRMAEMERLASLGKLAAAVAHEINNPLAGVLTYARLLSRHLQKRPGGRQAGMPVSASATPAGGSDEEREWIQIIEGETMRCGALVKNLLTFSRQVAMQVRENDVNAILDRVVRLVRHQLELQNIEWVWKPEGALPLLCDGGQIQQAVLAMVVNAMEAMPRGGSLSLRSGMSQETPPGEIWIEVEDSGAGIPADALPHIFEPFFTTKEEGKSIGMGLSVSYGIVKKHGGEIRVRSEARNGTCFRIVLPLGGAAAASGEDAGPRSEVA